MKNLNIRVEEEIMKQYKKFCEINGYSISKRIRNFILKELKKNENK